jgi:hypothetical protein
MSQGFQLSRLQAAFCKFMVVTTILFAHTTSLRATCCLICLIPIVKPFLTHWSWLWVVPFLERGIRAHGGCDRSTGDAYSSMVPDTTSDILVFRGPCTPILWFVFPIRLMRLIADRYFCHFSMFYGTRVFSARVQFTGFFSGFQTFTVQALLKRLNLSKYTSSTYKLVSY